MKIDSVSIRNFRRLEDVHIEFEERETIFVGPNNSGKTSATAVFRCFLGHRSFRIYDFAVDRMADFDKFGREGDARVLPAIELDIWFSVDPASIEFGRAFALLPNLSSNFNRVGVRMSYKATNPEKLQKAFFAAYPSKTGEPSAKVLSEFLAQDGILKRFFEIAYASLEKTADEPVALDLESSEGRRLIQSLIRVDFVDAQRNIDDEEGYRSNKLSSAFARFYRKNLEQAEVAHEAYKVIDENNVKLTEHYEKQFQGLMNMIRGLGVPAINDRELKIISTLSPESALKGNTDLLYTDRVRNHELPEMYNGLGYKNLIYMAIQVKDCHSQWSRTEENRPLCQMIFIEEPEVHLHAQIQQVFIAKIWDVLRESAKAEGYEDAEPQLVISTHSSHILDTVEFAKVRYFRRCSLSGEDEAVVQVLNATKVYSLRQFKPDAVAVDGQAVTKDEALEFLKRYLRLTHCDLFFADAAILVEGSVEKLLLPAMIDKVAPGLQSSYLTVLEVGGAYAHRFEGLLSFLHIPYLIITDLDSVSPTGNHPACRADKLGALTSNASLKHLLGVNSVADLTKLTAVQKGSGGSERYVTFQRDVAVRDGETEMKMRPRTLEEAFVYENYEHFRSGHIKLGITIPASLGDAYGAIYKRVMSNSFKKTDFAMAVLSAVVNWRVPDYIREGLVWLEDRLRR